MTSDINVVLGQTFFIIHAGSEQQDGCEGSRYNRDKEYGGDGSKERRRSELTEDRERTKRNFMRCPLIIVIISAAFIA
jgi:hypothetical protein